MKNIHYLILFVIGLAVTLLVAVFQKSPGYMDAEYYYSGGVRLAEGAGFKETILWNYLDDPVGLPHPSHGYWMPLASILAGSSMYLMGKVNFATARVLFIFLSACIPVLTAYLTYLLSPRVSIAILAGLLAVFSGFYLPYMPTTDTFSLFMCLGGLLIIVCIKMSQKNLPQRKGVLLSCAAGILVGLMHLTRADGVIWLIVIFGLLLSISLRDRGGGDLRFFIERFGACLAGYLLVMTPWFIRNYSVYGSLFSSGGIRTLWLTQYNELFIYPAAVLSFDRWWNSGLVELLHTRWFALGQSLQSFVAVQGLIFLAPFILIGGYQYRRNLGVIAGFSGWALTGLVMVMIFPYAGTRGGYFHSGSAVQPLFWSLAVLGLDSSLVWAGKQRKWKTAHAGMIFQASAIIFAVAISASVIKGSVLGADLSNPSWNGQAKKYHDFEAKLTQLGAASDDLVMVNNSPGYYAVTGRPAIAIPFSDLGGVQKAASRYGARYLLLELDQIQGASELFASQVNSPGLRFLTSVDGAQIYEFLP